MSSHIHECRICGVGWPTWCCRHRWTLGYVAVVVTLLLISAILDRVWW